MARLRMWLVLGCTLAGASPAAAADTPVAKVGDQIITQSQVDRVVERITAGRPSTPETRQSLADRTLQRLIDQQLVMVQLRTLELNATKTEIDVELKRLAESLKQRGQTLNAYWRESQSSESDFRRSLRWRLGWKRFLDRYLTEENLRNYFRKHRAEFDGTRLEVSHILWKRPEDAEQLPELKSTMSQVRQDILDGKLTFAAAAARYSKSATSQEGGRLGAIGRQEPMPESFSRAAFQLKAGAISPPVESSFGWHLIRCDRIVPGSGDYESSRESLEEAVTEYLFRWAADQQRGKVNVERF